MHHLAAVAAGAYLPCRPPNAWSPRVPAPPGPCYLLVASGTPFGWRGGCPAAGLVRGAVRHYCVGRCSALVVCARRSRPVRGGWGRCRVSCIPRFPLPAPRFPRCVWRAVLSRCPLSSLAGTPFHVVCAFRGLSPVPRFGVPRVSFARACARALAASAPSPLSGFMWRAHSAQSWSWAPVGPFTAVPAPPRVLPRSCALFGLLGGGAARSCSPLAWLRVVCPALDGPAHLSVPAPGGRGGGGSLCAILVGGAAGGPQGAGGRPTSGRPSAFPGQATKRVSLTLLWSWRAWPPYCSGSCLRVVPRRGPCGALVRWRGFACMSQPLWEQAGGGVGAGGIRAQQRPPPPGPAALSGGRGDFPPALGGEEGRCPRGPFPASRGPEGGSGGRREGGRAVVSPPPSSGVWFGLGKGLCRTPWPMVSTCLCADTTGLGESWLSGPKACRTVDRPRNPWWHTREGDVAVPVCLARAGQEGGACMLVALAGHDGSHGCAAPGPARWRLCRSSVSRFPRCGLVRPCRRL